MGLIREISNVCGELSPLLSFRLVGKLTNRQTSLGDTVVLENRGEPENLGYHTAVSARGVATFSRGWFSGGYDLWWW